MILSQALQIAERVKATLAPVCDRIAIVGSCRRKKPEVGDIEIVCIPKRIKCGLFGDEVSYSPDFISIGRELGEILEGDPRDGKYVKIWLPEQIQLDIFITNTDNWGLIYAIRTGSARFSHEVLASSWSKKGFKSEGGILYPARFDRISDTWILDRNNPKMFSEEIDLFNFLGLPWVAPEKREI